MSGVEARDPAASITVTSPSTAQPGRAKWLDPGSWSVGRWAWVAAAVAAIVYVPSLWNGFAFDDLPIIAENTLIRDWRAWGELIVSPYWPGETGSDFGAWRPTTNLVLSIVWQLSGGAALAFHLLNVFLHACATWLLVRLSAKVVAASVSGLAGLVFAVHPVHVEAVANGVGVAELLAAVFVLSALLVAVDEDRPGFGALTTVVLLYALGFGAKEGAVVLPALVLLVDAVRDRLRPRDLGTWIRDRLALLLGLFGASAVMLWARAEILGGVANTFPPLGANLLTEVPRIWTLGEVWYHMLRVLTVPTWLSPDYSPDLIPVVLWWTPRGLAGAAGVLAVLTLTWFAAQRLRKSGNEGEARGEPVWAVGTAFGVVWFMIALSPVANVFFLTGILLAERTLYLPSAGVAVAMSSLVVGVYRAVRSARVPRVAVAVTVGFLLSAWTTRTVTYIPVWRDNEALFTYMARYIPESVRAQFFRGDIRAVEGDEELALRHYRPALQKANPPYTVLLNDAQVALEAGRLQVARLFLARAAAIAPGAATPRTMLASIALRAEDWSRAEYWARETLEVDPADASGWFLLSVALGEQQRWLEAAVAREEVARLDTVNWQPWYGVVELRLRAGDEEGARAAADSLRTRTSDQSTLTRLDSLMVDFGVVPGAG